MGEKTRPLDSNVPQGVWSSGCGESPGRGGVMGDSGRSRWSEGVAILSLMYLWRRFLIGALTSESFNRKEGREKLFRRSSKPNGETSKQIRSYLHSVGWV